jgi:hypothetical protein
MNDLTELKRHPRVIELYRSKLPLKQEGRRFRGLCPFHADRNATNFDVFPSDGVYVYKCLVCGVSGSIIDLIQKTDNTDLRGAVEIIRKFCGDWYRDGEKADANFAIKQETKTYKKLTDAEWKIRENNLANNPAAQQWLVKERGITPDTIKKCRLGFVQNIGMMAGENNPLSNKGWIAIPSIENGEVICVKYRSIVAKKLDGKWSGFCRQGGMKTVLHGTEDIDPLEPLLVVEGEFDKIINTQAGFCSVSLPNGAKDIPDAHMRDQMMLADCVILAGDMDEEGQTAMQRLLADLKERTYLLQWPAPFKDANEFFMSGCGQDINKYREEVLRLIEEAKSKPIVGVYNIQQSLLNTDHARVPNHPDRLELPWKSIHDMAIILPGTVTTIYSTESGLGKSTLAIQATIHHARVKKEIVLNYQAEMSPNQIDTIFSSHLLGKHRLQLDDADYKTAGKLLGPDFKYYIGRNTSLTTIGEVLNLIEVAVRRYGARVVVLDNLHFLCRNETDSIKAQANAMQRITNMTAQYGLKFILVHQARKADQNHKRKVTHVSDLDGSKAVQNDSSTIFSLHREEVKHGKDGNESDHEYSPITEIRLQKARDKGEGRAFTKLLFKGAYCTFVEMTNVPVPAPQIEESIF